MNPSELLQTFWHFSWKLQFTFKIRKPDMYESIFHVCTIIAISETATSNLLSRKIIVSGTAKYVSLTWSMLFSLKIPKKTMFSLCIQLMMCTYWNEQHFKFTWIYISFFKTMFQQYLFQWKSCPLKHVLYKVFSMLF